MSHLPEKTKAVVLPAYNENVIRALLGLKYLEIPVPSTGHDEVLVKMEAATCNPSDIAFIRGGYNVKKRLPAIPGFEGAGIVIDAGKEARHLLGSKVSCVVQEDKSGAWAEFSVAKAKNCIVLNEGVSFEQGASLAINPLTSMGLFELAQKKECKAIILSAAGGQVAAFIRNLAIENKIPVINIVRKEEHVKKLGDSGIPYVYNSTDENFAEELKKISLDLGATIAFDAVGGELTALLLNAMPPNSEVVIYGGLSGSHINGLKNLELIFKGKKLYGFNLKDWTRSLTQSEFERATNLVQEKIIKGEIRTNIQAVFKLTEAVEGIRTYIKSMSQGKILFTP